MSSDASRKWTGTPRSFRSRSYARGWPAILAVMALLATGISGAIAALGDTLFKATCLVEAIAQGQ